jgi:tRNA threonylcarbamoyladenosine biosynthesis protein TsaB
MTMSNTHYLVIDTASEACSVALCNPKTGFCQALEANGESPHASQLTLLIQSLLNEHHLRPSALMGIVVNKGPGSYTGLRIGVSAAKAIAYAANLPLYGLSGLDALVKTAPTPPNHLTLAVLDARLGNFYLATNLINASLPQFITQAHYPLLFNLMAQYDTQTQLIGTAPPEFLDMAASKQQALLLHYQPQQITATTLAQALPYLELTNELHTLVPMYINPPKITVSKKA